MDPSNNGNSDRNALQTTADMSRAGEVILADTVHLEAECPTLYCAPDFGSFIRVESDTGKVYAVVYHIATGCIDSNRKTQALGMTANELETRYPHLKLVLRTTFSARIVAHDVGSGIRQWLPGQPPRIHSFGFQASPDEVREVTASPSFLRTLSIIPEVPVEEVLASAIRHAGAAWEGRPEASQRWQEWCKYIVRLYRDDYDRADAVMQRVGPPPAGGLPWEEALPVSTFSEDPFK